MFVVICCSTQFWPLESFLELRLLLFFWARAFDGSEYRIVYKFAHCKHLLLLCNFEPLFLRAWPFYVCCKKTFLLSNAMAKPLRQSCEGGRQRAKLCLFGRLHAWVVPTCILCIGLSCANLEVEDLTCYLLLVLLTWVILHVHLF